jgi:5'-nucleotidase
MTFRIAPVAAALALAACTAVPPPQSTPATAAGTVTVGIAAINDFHGALEPPKQAVPTILPRDGVAGGATRPNQDERLMDNSVPVVAVPAGGAAWLASAIDSVRAPYANVVTVSAGDMVGASQLASSLYLDEPAVGVMNRIGLDFNAVGNHEFDRGAAELRRLALGGCEELAARKPCQLERWTGAKFPFLAANSIRPDGTTLFPGTGIRSFGSGKRRVTLGFIGVTLKDTASLTAKENLQGVTFADEADTINALVPRLKAQGADAIVVLIHQGGRTDTRIAPDPSGCTGLGGGVRPILDRLSPQVDVVVSGHTHWAYVCDYAALNPARPFLLTSAGVFGELVTDITLEIDPAAHRVVAKRARNVIVQSPGYSNARGNLVYQPAFPLFQPRADVAEYVARYVAASKDFIQRPVGKLAGLVERPGGDGSNKGGTLGNLVADAQLAATRKAGAQIALMNVFGLRAPSMIAPAPDGSVTFGQIYAVQPFANDLVTQTLTGAELKAVLEQGFDADQPIQFLSVSQGFSYAVDMARPAGNRVVRMTLNGVPIDPQGDYRVTTNSFLAAGGDSFSVLTKQRDAAIGMTDLAAMEAYLAGATPRPVPSEERAVDLNPGVTPAKPAPMSN